MGRVSLTEDYDDRSVISKLNEMDKRVKENTTVVTSAEASAKASAAAAQETADRFAGSVGAVVQNANAQINASKAQVDQAKAEVDETVTTVAQAVQTANQASASAQQSANTVATYDTRLTAVEDADTQNVKLDTNQIITGHKKFVQLSTAGIPLEAERKGNGAGVSVTQTDQKMTDAGVQYYSGMYIYDGNGNRVGGWYPVKEDNNRTTLRMRHNSTNGETRELVVDGDFIMSNSMVSKRYVESTDGVTNNLVHKSADETVNGFKTMNSGIVGRIGRHLRVTAEQKICIADFEYTPSTTGSNLSCKVWLTFHGRYCQFDGWFGFQITPAGEVTNMTKGGLSDGTDNYTTFYAYPIPGTHKIRMAIGNARSTNNHMIFNSIGGMIDAGYDLALDYTSTGSFVTDEISGSTASMLLIGGA